MKIGIITSWMETLALFRFLTRYNHEYIIYFDSLNAPYWEKHFESSLKNIKKGIDYLKEKWVDTIILPPCYELSLIEKEPLVLPLFKTYLFQEVFTYSLVGKLGLAWEYADLEKGQELIENLSKNYQPSLTQKTTKKFSYPFHYRSKEMGILNPLLTRISCISCPVLLWAAISTKVSRETDSIGTIFFSKRLTCFGFHSVTANPATLFSQCKSTRHL